MKYFEIEILKNGKINKKEITSPIWEGEIYNSSKPNILAGTHCSEDNIDKASSRIIKSVLKDAKKEMEAATKNYTKLLELSKKILK